MSRARLRDLGIVIGNLPTGNLNAITDVPGVRVGHHTLVYDQPRMARTGVTVILPREAEVWKDNAFAGLHVLNGYGEMTGAHWLEESGLLSSPIGLTNTYQVGVVRDALIAYGRERGVPPFSCFLPIVAETYDGWLNDIDAFHLTQAHVYEALAASEARSVEEGNVGGGTGMICHEFKGGIGTSSRLADTRSGQYTVGALVQANYGDRYLLRVDGVPVGREIGPEHTPSHRTAMSSERPSGGGSIIAIVATDAPLLPVQCKRLAQRATIGLARVGGVGRNHSGDIFLAFATGNHVGADASGSVDLQMLPHHHIDPLFEAVAEAVEEAILNCLTAAETMTGHKGRTAHALPLDELQRVMVKHSPFSSSAKRRSCPE